MTEKFSNDPVTIDCHYLGEKIAASYLLKASHLNETQGVFIETNTAHAVPKLLAALKGSGLSPEQISWIIITHVHLDHAGGASALMTACPNATLLCHPKAAPHMADPRKLIKSAQNVYGEATFEALYGKISAIDPQRIRVMNDGEELTIPGRTLRFIETKGHANHHFCVLDSGSEGIFTGDSFGLAYPSLQKQGLFIFPSTSPTDFDPKEAKNSIQKILNSGAKRAFLTHFGEIRDLSRAASQLWEHLDFSEGLLEKAIHLEDSIDMIEGMIQFELEAYNRKFFETHRMHFTPRILEQLKLDFKLNAAGIAYTAKKRKSTPVLP